MKVASKAGTVQVVDSGGITRYGLSKRAHPTVDIERLTWDQALGIYQRQYVRAIQAHRWHPAIQLIALDAAINQGTHDATEFLQRAARTRVDHIIGPKTIKAVQAVDTKTFLERYAAYRGEDYMENPRRQLNAFGLGWCNRMFNVYTRSYRIANGANISNVLS